MKTFRTAILGVALAVGCLTAGSAEPPEVRLWTNADLKSLDKTLIAKMGDAKTSYTQVMTGDTYKTLVMHREVTSEPERHLKLIDFFLFTSGAGEIRVGGSVTGVKTVAPNEEQGQTLDGGTVYKVKQGDVMFIPANVWHQTIIPKGGKLSAIVFKAG